MSRHPKRVWFGQKTYAQLRDAPGMSPMMDSAVTKAVLSPARQVEEQAQQIINAKLLKPWQLREKYPMGWIDAPYVKLPPHIAAIVVCQ